MKQNTLKNWTLAALFLAMGLVLPFLTGQIQQIGNLLLPMHLPVLLCGLICGWEYGLVVGLILPLLRSVLFGMPPLYPIAAAMALELAAYGLFAGLFYNRSRWRCVFSLYRALLCAMVLGRIVWGGAMTALLGLSGGAFTWEAFAAGAILNAVPGIALQLTLIPAIMVALDRTRLIPFTASSRGQSRGYHGRAR